MSSFVETKGMDALKSFPIEFVEYPCKLKFKSGKKKYLGKVLKSTIYGFMRIYLLNYYLLGVLTFSNLRNKD